ncbi:PREDICTED: uncharacterized protein LOC108499858 [Lepidothrix coronata]|uniref:Uncharacterized protein LOC108499858 n=1 Tax=Lepidothrix coronata TaxID=321398 RepID=A0A6J0HNE9_9PASS|nr:PREDICTED: uncharacterized protein LOC108499858 [Lepidothrix coronata]
MDGSQCSVGMAGAMEKGQLAAPRETHLGAEMWQDIAGRVEKLSVKVRHVDAHVGKKWANEEHCNNEQADRAARIKVSQVDLDWQHKGELFLARWAHDASGHQGRDATYRWARDRGVDLTKDIVSQVIHDCETCAAIKQAKRVKPLWYGGRWSKYRYGEAWQVDYITLPKTCQGKHYVLTMVEGSTGWLETYPVPHATARNTILGLEKQVLWRHGTPERIESDNGTHFKNGLVDTWAKEHGIEWVYHIPYHAPAAGRVEQCNGLLKTTLKALCGETLKTLGAAFSKGHLVGQHPRLHQSSWPCPIRTFAYCRWSPCGTYERNMVHEKLSTSSPSSEIIFNYRNQCDVKNKHGEAMLYDELRKKIETV